MRIAGAPGVAAITFPADGGGTSETSASAMGAPPD